MSIISNLLSHPWEPGGKIKKPHPCYGTKLYPPRCHPFCRSPGRFYRAVTGALPPAPHRQLRKWRRACAFSGFHQPPALCKRGIRPAAFLIAGHRINPEDARRLRRAELNSVYFRVSIADSSAFDKSDFAFLRSRPIRQGFRAAYIEKNFTNFLRVSSSGRLKQSDIHKYKGPDLCKKSNCLPCSAVLL